MINEGVCPVCESRIEPGSGSCEVCGADLKLLAENAKAQYVCPECGNELGEYDSRCPKCGVTFAQEEQVIFQCPACNAEVEATANKCPSCGAEFLSDEEASAQAEVPEGIESVPPVEMQEAETFDDIAQGITTGNPETLISEFEETLRGMEPTAEEEASEEEQPGPEMERGMPAAPEEHITAQARPAGASAAADPAPEKHGRFRFRFGRRKYEKQVEEAPKQAPREEMVFRAAAPAPATQQAQVQQNPAAWSETDEMKPLIEQLRTLLKFAGDASIDISDGKKYLDTSVEYAKSGDGSEALKQIRFAYKSIESNIQSFFKDKMEIMRKQIEIDNFSGERKQDFESRLSSISELVREGSFEDALESVSQFQSDLSPKASQFGEAKELIDRLEELLKYADEIGIDYNSARMIFTEARKHLAVGDWSSALVLARQSRESLMRSIPGKLLSEMNRARSEIIDAKIGGMKVTEFIATLKEASNAYNEGKFDESLRFMNIFRREFDRARSLSSRIHA